jgi:hypothetical protein
MPFLTIQDLLCFHVNFRIDFSISVKSDIRILMETAFNLMSAFGSVAIFRILILLTYEHRKSFQYLLNFLQCFIVFIINSFIGTQKCSFIYIRPFIWPYIRPFSCSVAKLSR